jgi:hypothetical protein
MASGVSLHVLVSAPKLIMSDAGELRSCATVAGQVGETGAAGECVASRFIRQCKIYRAGAKDEGARWDGAQTAAVIFPDIDAENSRVSERRN